MRFSKNFPKISPEMFAAARDEIKNCRKKKKWVEVYPHNWETLPADEYPNEGWHVPDLASSARGLLDALLRDALIEYDKWLIAREGFAGGGIDSETTVDEYLKSKRA